MGRHFAINIYTRRVDTRIAFETCLDIGSKFCTLIGEVITKPDVNADTVFMYSNLANGTCRDQVTAGILIINFGQHGHYGFFIHRLIALCV